MAGLGKSLIVLGALMALIGLLIAFAEKVPWLGRLPGDFTIRKNGVVFYFPLATSVVLSVLASVLLYLFRR